MTGVWGRRARRAPLVALSVAGGLVAGLLLYVKFFAPGPIQGDLKGAQSAAPGLRLLFVGNSLTSFNDLPRIVARLAEGDDGAPKVFAVRFTVDSTGLDDHAVDKRLLRLFGRARWDDIVLQERSRVPAVPALSATVMRYSAQFLASRVRAVGARPWLFMTWGYRDGDPGGPPGDTYPAMQARIATAYEIVGRQTGTPVAPAGLAWARVHAADPGLALWGGDGVHPSRAGSFLAACVLYASLTGRDPTRSDFDDGLDRHVATELKAAATVPGDGAAAPG